MTFVTTNDAGIGAIGKLCTIFGHRMGNGDSGLPIIKLEVTSYIHKRFGPVEIPNLVIQSWHDSKPSR